MLPGGFKPPTKGHYSILSKFKDFDKMYIIISSKTRDMINQEQSFKIWQIYLKHFLKNNKKYKNKIIIVKSTDKSPLITAFKFSLGLKKGSKLILVKSYKDKSNKRFDMFTKIKGIKIQEKLIKKYKNINSRDMRKFIKEKNIKKIKEYLPNSLSDYLKSKIINIIY